VKCFISIHPSAEEAARLQERRVLFARRLEQLCPAIAAGVKWTRSDQLHLTIEFLGEITRQQLVTVEAEIQAIADETPPGSLQFQAVGAFPVYRTPKVLWWRVLAAGGVAELQRKIRLRLLDTGMHLDTAYFPHVNMGRVGRIKPAEDECRTFTALLDAFSAELLQAPEVWPARGISIMRSAQAKAGAEYHCLRVIPFGGVGG